VLYDYRTLCFDAHLTIVLAVLAVGHWTEARTGLEIRAGQHIAPRRAPQALDAGSRDSGSVH
jgi:hypothetical protein